MEHQIDVNTVKFLNYISIIIMIFRSVFKQKNVITQAF